MSRISRIEFQGMLDEYGEQSAIVPVEHPKARRIAAIAHRIISANEELRCRRWTVTVVADPMRNAMVLPSGDVFVHTGMLDVCDNDDQLAVVLAHEFSHVLLNHVAEKLSYVNVVHLALLIPMAVLWAFIPSDGIAIVTDWFVHRVIDLCLELPYSRDIELEADEVGLQLAAKACVDVREAPAFWAKMALMAQAPVTEDDLQPPEILSTHPAHESRAVRLAELLPAAVETRVSCGCARLPLVLSSTGRTAGTVKVASV